MQWLKEHWLLVLPMVLGAFAVARLMPKGEPRSSLVARLVGLAAVGIVGGTLLQPTGSVLSDALFYLFAGVAVLGAVLMITHRNPAYSALWFAVVTLAVCGLFLLQSAPFLASATVIVYAGAIIVTFLFVLMLAQQAGATNYDQRSRQPGVAAFTGFVLLGALLFVLSPSKEQAATRPVTGFVSLAPKVVPVDQSSDQLSTTPQSTSATTAENFGTMRGLGRSLFGDYLFAVELAGTLLLVASIGAIVIAPKRSSGKL
ncbi:MAG: NADH-quinone oxidoreductase subunit J [Planctomycetota bacterium]|nr:MAG: NADH-quinone oxidoreductase subunit J [Planctomycetota bacterium]